MIYRLEPGLTHGQELLNWWLKSELKSWLSEEVLSWLPFLLPATLLFLGLFLWLQSLMMLYKLWKEARKK